jgi:hypothetical protein
MSGYCWINPRHRYYKKHNTTIARDCPYDGKQKVASRKQKQVSRAQAHAETRGRRMRADHDEDANDQESGPGRHFVPRPR